MLWQNQHVRTCNTPLKLLLSPATTSHRVWVCGGWGWRMELNSQRDKQPQWFGRSINHPGYFTNYHDHHPTSSPPPQNNNNKAPHPNGNACFGSDLVQQQQSGDQKWRLRKVFDDSEFNKNPSFTFSFTTIPDLSGENFQLDGVFTQSYPGYTPGHGKWKKQMGNGRHFSWIIGGQKQMMLMVGGGVEVVIIITWTFS